MSSIFSTHISEIGDELGKKFPSDTLNQLSDLLREAAQIAEHADDDDERVIAQLRELATAIDIGNALGAEADEDRESRWIKLCEHYEVDPEEGQSIAGGAWSSYDVNRFAAVAAEMTPDDNTDTRFELATFPTFESACEVLGSAVIDGYLPDGVFDLDTGERIDLHVASPVVTRSEDQQSANPLDEETA